MPCDLAVAAVQCVAGLGQQEGLLLPKHTPVQPYFTVKIGLLVGNEPWDLMKLLLIKGPG